MQDRKLLGTTKVSKFHRITLVENVVKEMGVEQGNMIAFYREDGKIVIEKT